MGNNYTELVVDFFEELAKGYVPTADQLEPEIKGFLEKNPSNEATEELAFFALKQLTADINEYDRKQFSLKFYRMAPLYQRIIEMALGDRTNLSKEYLSKSLLQIRKLDHHVHCDPGLLLYVEKYISQFGMDDYLEEIYQHLNSQLRCPHPVARDGYYHFVNALRNTYSQQVRESFFDPFDVLGRRLSDDWPEMEVSLKETLSFCWGEKYRSAPTKGWVKKMTAHTAENSKDHEKHGEYLTGLFSYLSDVGSTAVRNINARQNGASITMYSSYPGKLYLRSENEVALSYLLWYATLIENEDLQMAIGKLGLSSLQKIREIGNLSNRNGGAAMLAFTMMSPKVGVIQLLKIRKKSRNKNVLKLVEKHLRNMAAKMNLTEDAMLELSCPDFGLAEGVIEKDFGDFTAIVETDDIRKPVLRWRNNSNEKIIKTVPKKLKDEQAAEVKYLKSQLKELTATFAVHRERLENCWVNETEWLFADWRESYVDHPLLSRFSSLLIWYFDEKETAIVLDGKWVNASGENVDIGSSEKVQLWHPIYSDVALVEEWRAFFMERELLQPFKQAYREIYVLTDAERNTGNYSNRFAAHILKQYQLAALAKARLWDYSLQGNFDGFNVPTKHIKSTGMKAEFWMNQIDGHLSHSGLSEFMATDQVRFYKDNEQLDLETVNAIVFSELMRDVDLFVGVSSLGNNPNWQDGEHADYWLSYSFGDLSATAISRKSVLESILPKLKIGKKCRLENKFLIVEGSIRTYKIHLGSSNIMMEPNDEYLCIVPDAGKMHSKVFLPFDGDRTLSVILSKAFLLAADDKIKDQTILTQINRLN